MSSCLQRVEDAVDPHHHFWAPDTHAWLAKVEDGGHIAGPFKSIMRYRADEFMADASTFKVKKSVHVQAHFDGEPLAETEYLQGVADKTGVPTGIVAFADLSDENVEAVLKAHCKHANVRGIRQMLDYHPTVVEWRQCPRDDYMTDPIWLQGLKLLPKYNLSFDMQLHVPQMAAANEVVKANPDLQFIINHAGFPASLTDEYLASWREGLSALAQHDNVAIKLSGFNMFHHDWTQKMLHPLIEFCIKIFSTKRCMFASNFPVDKVNATYADLMGAYFQICCDLGMSQDDVNLMFRDNACRIYRL